MQIDVLYYYVYSIYIYLIILQYIYIHTHCVVYIISIMILVWVCPKVADVSSVHGSWQFNRDNALPTHTIRDISLFLSKNPTYWINSLWLYNHRLEFSVSWSILESWNLMVNLAMKIYENTVKRSDFSTFHHRNSRFDGFFPSKSWPLSREAPARWGCCHGMGSF